MRELTEDGGGANRPVLGRRGAPPVQRGLAVRQRIQTARIVDRLQKFIHGQCEMSPTQVEACKILLRKTLPDLTAVDLNAGAQGGLVIQIMRFSDRAVLNAVPLPSLPAPNGHDDGALIEGEIIEGTVN